MYLRLLTISLLTICGFGLTGCNDFKGKIEVLETLKFKVTKGKDTIEPGIYKAKIDFPKKNKCRVEITLPKKSPTFYFDIGSRYFPKYNGPINIPSAENGQPYDLVGELETTEEESRETWSSESCTYTRYEQRCSHDRNGRTVCQTVPVNYYGYRDVRYFDRTTHQRLDLNFEVPSTGRAAAHTAGAQSWSERIYTYQGYCR